MIVAGKYEVLGKLGQGGQGSVYKVRHLGLDEIRALKVQPDHGVGEETVARFRREGRALARLRHSHIVQVFDLGRDGDQYYLEMEYVDGPNLAQFLKANGRPPLLDALEIARQVADALTYAHVQPYVDSAGVQHTGMVHRDIKPSNILLRDRTPMYALLADFGLVKLGDPGERTTTGTMLGTYKYSAPEQLGLKRARERVTVDFRADVFAFGLVLYELLEGRQFHAGLEPQEILARVLFEPDALVPEFTVSVLPTLRALVGRMVQRDPENRPPNMKVVLAALDEALGDLRGGDAPTVVVTPHGRSDAGPRTEEELEEQIQALVAERERRRAHAARGDAQAARARALEAGAVELATPEFETAVRREEEASFALSAGDVSQARQLYEATCQLFTEAESQAGAARERRATEAVRDEAGAAREGARAAGAPGLAAGLWTGAEEREQAAEALLATGDVSEARRAFEGVATAFRAARSAAETERERQRAEASEAAAAAARARAEAEAADAAAHAVSAWSAACEAFDAGDRQRVVGDDLAAASSFRRAGHGFADATRMSLDAQARVAADGARRAAVAADAAGAEELAAEAYAAARRQLEAASAAHARGDAAAARALFTEAESALDAVAALAIQLRAAEAARQREEERRRAEEEAACRLAEEEERRRAAEERSRQLAAAMAARSAASAAAERAHAADAKTLAANLLSGGVARQDEAEDALRRDALPEATAAFRAAAAAFDVAGRGAQHEAARRQALEARTQASAARAVAGDAEAARWASQDADEAEALWRSGEDALARDAVAAAARAFADAARAFAGAAVVARERAADAQRQEAEARRLREEEEARRRAEAEARARADEEARRRAAAERARQLAAVEAARTAAAGAAGRAREAGAETLAPAAMASASARLADAEAAAGQETFVEAAQHFATAELAFDAAAAAASVEAARQRALAARARAAAARDAADVADASRWTNDAWGAAEEQWTGAEGALARGAFDVATETFGSATGAFQTATTAARAAADEARRQLEEAARQRAEEQTRRRAAEAEAKRRAADEAERKAAAEAQRRAAEEQAQQLAAVEDARAIMTAAAARARDAGVDELAPAALTAAAARQADAEAAVQRAAFAAAARLFAEAGVAFDQATEAAEVEARRRRDEEERSRRAEAEARRRAQEEAAQRAAAEAKRVADEEAARQAAEEAQRRAAAAAKRRAEDEAAQRRAAAEAKQREDEARRAAAEAEQVRRAQAEARRRAEQAARDAEAPDEVTIVAPPSPLPDEATVIAPPLPSPLASVEAPGIPAPRPVEPITRAWWPYAAAAAVALALGLGYVLLRPRPEQIVTRPQERPERPPERTPDTTPEAPPPTSPPPAPVLAWGAVSPPASGAPTVKEGEPLRFAAPVVDSDAQPGLELRWMLDGKEVGRGPSWDYTPGFAEGGKTREVQVVAISEARRLEQTWQVQVEDVPRPPVIASVTPAEGTVTIEAGAAQKFALRANDPDAGDRLTYTWERNGKRVASGAQADLTVRDATDGEQISVTVTDQDGASAGARSWKVALKSPPPVEPQPPRIVGQTPAAKGRLAVEEGRSVDFSLKVTDPDPKEKFAYAWFVDGRPVGTGKTLRFEAPSLPERTASRRVEAEVTDASGLKSDRVGWDVEVRWSPPAILRLEPKDRKVTLEAGQTRALRAGATSAAKGDLTYEWKIDGKVQGASPSNRLELPSDLPAGSHAIEVASIDTRGLRSDPLGWTVDVRPVPLPTLAPPPTTIPPRATLPTTPTTTPTTSPPTTLVSRLPPPTTLPPPGRVGTLSEAEARGWLAGYRSALQGKDRAALEGLGFARAAEIVGGMGFIDEVRVGGESISVSGGTATVSFDRTDLAQGKELRLRQTCRLEKGADGRVRVAGSCQTSR